MSTAGKRIVFFGTPEPAAQCLAHLIARGHDIAGVISQPDRPVGRHQVVLPTPVKAVAQAAGIPVIQPGNCGEEACLEQVRAWSPFVCVVVAYGQILPSELLNIPECFINLHFSLLPAYRGAAPVQHALMDGCAETGITVQHVVRKLDMGDIILQQPVAIDDEDDATSLLAKCVAAGAPVLSDAIDLLAEGTAPRVPQGAAGVSHARKMRKEDGIIDWHAPARVIFNQIRACVPWPGAVTWLHGQPVKIWRSREYFPSHGLCGHHDENVAAVGHVPGEALPSRRNLLVTAGAGVLEVLELQPAGKHRMTGAAFLAGHGGGEIRFAKPDAASREDN